MGMLSQESVTTTRAAMDLRIILVKLERIGECRL